MPAATSQARKGDSETLARVDGVELAGRSCMAESRASAAGVRLDSSNCRGLMHLVDGADAGHGVEDTGLSSCRQIRGFVPLLALAGSGRRTPPKSVRHGGGRRRKCVRLRFLPRLCWGARYGVEEAEARSDRDEPGVGGTVPRKS